MERLAGRRPGLACLVFVVFLLIACPSCKRAGDSGPPDDPTYARERDLPTEPETEVSWPQEQVLYYATDRAPLETTFSWYLLRFVWAVGVLLIGRLVLGSARKIVAPPYQWRVTFGNWVLAVAVVALAAWGAWEALRMATLQGRLDLFYGSQRLKPAEGSELPLEVGMLTVSIPREHEVGLVERPSPFRGDLFEDPEDHMVLTGVWALETEDFFRRVREKIGGEHDVLVFVHGYNNSFEDASLRAAQIAWDLGFPGAPILYSWPSMGTIPGYLADAGNVSWSVPHLHAFLKRLMKETEPARIHLIAHSMGNRVLTAALRRIRAEAAPGETTWDPFQQIVLAAPDIDADTFRDDIAPAILGGGSRITLYASANDQALLASRGFHGEPRAGEAGDTLVVVPGIDTVDVTRVTGGHSYIGNNNRVLDDLGLILEGEVSERRVKHPHSGTWYWVLEKPEDAEPESHD